MFFRFPLSRPDVLSLWIRAVRLENFKPTANTVICSDHFTDDIYLESSLNKKLLKKEAVPSIFQFPKHLKAEPSRRRKLNRVCIASTSAETNAMDVSEVNI